jgi:hypothetical protein
MDATLQKYARALGYTVQVKLVKERRLISTLKRNRRADVPRVDG